jgi:hypothetical protein
MLEVDPQSMALEVEDGLRFMLLISRGLIWEIFLLKVALPLHLPGAPAIQAQCISLTHHPILMCVHTCLSAPPLTLLAAVTDT